MNSSRGSLCGWLAVGMLLCSMPCEVRAVAEAGGAMTLTQLVQASLDASAGLDARDAQIRQRQAERDEVKARWYPTFQTSYTFERERDPTYIVRTLTDPERDFTWALTFTQPVYDPNRLNNELTLAELQLSKAELLRELEARHVVIDMLTGYYTYLKALSQLEVANGQVERIEAHEVKALAFHEAGKIALNELLQAGVQLANARRDMTAAENRLRLAEARINLLLRRPQMERVRVVETASAEALAPRLEDCLVEANRQRIETRIAEVDLAIAQTRFQMARHAYHPTASINGFYYRKGTHADLHDTSGMHRTEGWQFKAELAWTLWSGNRRSHRVAASRADIAQAHTNRDALSNSIGYEVQQAYQDMIQADHNTKVMQKALAQAEENLRLNQGRFDEQVADTTDVLDAQSLLTLTREGYVSALYDQQIARTKLKESMGRDLLEALDDHGLPPYLKKGDEP